MTDLEWTDEPPEEPGWYWLRIEESYTEVTELRQVTPSGMMFINGDPLHRWIEDMNDNVEWAGPIPEPE